MIDPYPNVSCLMLKAPTDMHSGQHRYPRHSDKGECFNISLTERSNTIPARILAGGLRDIRLRENLA